MKSEYSILTKIAEHIAERLNDYMTVDEEYSGYLHKIDDKNVVVDFPDIDNMPKNVMFFVTPEDGYMEPLTTGGDSTDMTVQVYVVCKKDTRVNLIRRAFGYYSALWMMLKNNQTLDNYVDFIDVTNFDYYPATDNTGTCVIVQATLDVRWEKQYFI